MNQNENRRYLIERLLQEQPRYAGMRIPEDEGEQRTLLRSLLNVRMPAEIDDEFVRVQDEYLTEVNREKGVVNCYDMEEVQPGICIWQGDITRLAVGAIVNAANSGMTGCYQPCHNCIDNCIHTYAGIQLRQVCAKLMEAQGFEEPTGQAKITPAYNLPCDYVIHTVGPIVQGRLTAEHERLLESCYRSCLALAEENGVESIAFCCISTGVFMFPNERAARIAVDTVKNYRKSHTGIRRVVFNVFKDTDFAIYRQLLKKES
jgi:O-acetyl-ADP-ribose deacetylase (regulator of RNase III)